MEVLNHDIKGIFNRVNRYIVEIYLSQSSSVSVTHPADIKRISSFILDIRERLALAEAAPVLDLPKTSPRVYALSENPVIPKIENEDLADILRLMELFRDELINSQSARMSAQMMPAEMQRITEILDKVDHHMAFLHGEDLPETAPNAPVTGAGRAGI